METRKLSLVFAISGFIYAVFLFFVFLLVFEIYNLELFFQEIKDYLPYLSIIIFFFAFVIGIISELFIQKVIMVILGKSYNAKHEVNMMMNLSEEVRKNIYASYDKLIILRHLIVGLFLTSISFSVWIRLSDFNNKDVISSYVLIPCGFLLILSIIAYCIHRTLHKQFMKEVDKFLKQN